MSEARLLIVEDNEEVGQMLALFFGSRGFKVALAEDGASALAEAREFLPSLLLLDVGLPDTDGYDLFKKFRESARTRHIPAIFLTRRGKKADKITGLTLGADDFITKPFDLEELFLRVQNAIARAQRDHLSDAHTGLPSGQMARDQIAAAGGRSGRSAIEFRLRHTSEFRDQYGALAGSDLLRYTALLLNNVLNSLGRPDDFLGQTGEETFVIVTASERGEMIRKASVDKFNSDVLQHYGMGQRSGEVVRVRDSSGTDHTLPVLTMEAVLLR